MQANGQLAPAYKYYHWANTFIDQADAAFGVSARQTYGEMGSAFRPSFRIGFLVIELHCLENLRGNEINGPYSMEMSLDLCNQIIDMAERVQITRTGAMGDYMEIQHRVASYHKPLAVAHSAIASHLNTLAMVFSLPKFQQIAVHHGLMTANDDASKCDPFALIAKHYHIAAQNELPDARLGALFWWAYAANMARAKAESGFTLGNLRQAMEKAKEAEKLRDEDLFGPNPQKGGSFESIARLVAGHFEDEDDSFVLPAVEISSGDKGGRTMLKVDGGVICSDFEQYQEVETKLLKAKRAREKNMDTSEIQKQHGEAIPEIPSLETLCIRELHICDAGFARGETDGATIMYKAMMASQQEEKKS